MVNETLIILISINMGEFHKLSYMYSHQRSKVTYIWKIIFVEYPPDGGQGGP